MTIEKIAGEAKTTTGAAYSRRNFLKGVTAAGALAAFGLAGCAPKTTSEMAATGTAASNAADVNWDEETEVLVVGSGYAGLNLNYKDKLQLMAEKSNEVFEWTVSEIGVKWAQDEATGAPQLIAQGGHTVTRCIPPLVNSGSGIVKPLIEKLSGLGVEVEAGKQLVGLVRDETGRVVGATVAEGCSDYDPATASRARLVRREPAKYPGMHRSSPSAAPSCSRRVGSPIIAALGTTRCPPQPPQAPCSTRSRPPSPPAQHSPSPAFCSPAYATAGWRRGCSSRPPAWRSSPT